MDITEQLQIDLENFLDDQNRVTQWPAKPKLKLVILKYLALKFETGRNFSEPEINAILKTWHIFNDWPLLRTRAL